MLHNNWTILIFIVLLLVVLVIILLFVNLNNRNKKYYDMIHSDLLSLVPLKIDLHKQTIFFFDKLAVLNYQNRLTIFVFKSMINRKAKVELEIMFQNLLINNFPFRPDTYSLSFQLNNKIITYDLSLDYYDSKNKVLYGKMQSNSRYNRFLISQNIALNPEQLTVAKTDFVDLITDFFKKEKQNQSDSLTYEYMILIKIKNYYNLESVLTHNNIESMELLLTYFSKFYFGKDNTIICKYYDGQFLLYTKRKKVNLFLFQKKINNYIKSNLIEKSSYLQIQTQIIAAFIAVYQSESSVYTLYNQIIDLNAPVTRVKDDFIEIKLKPGMIKNTQSVNNYSILYSQEIKNILTIKISPVFEAIAAKEPCYYYAHLDLIKNDYYDNYHKLIRNIQDAGLWWKIFEPLLLKALENYSTLNVNKDFVVPLSLIELENKTILTQIINIVNKRQTLFNDCKIIFEFSDNNMSVINNSTKYENIINTLREHNIKIAFSHELKNISNYKLISRFKPDLVVIKPSILDETAFNFNKYVNLIICLNYLNILGIKNIMAYGVNNMPQIVLLKSLKIKYLSGSFFEISHAQRNVLALNYDSYWKWKNSQKMMKGI